MKRWAWDELSEEIVEFAPDEATGESMDEWNLVEKRGHIRIYRSDRGHLGIEVKANTEEGATFLIQSTPEYKEWNAE